MRTDRWLRTLGWLLALMAAGAVARASPDAAAGRKTFATCAACHTPGQAGPAGPDLRGVVGRKAGTLAGFRFSRAMKNAKRTWNAETLDTFLAEPQAAVPGNVMPYPGLPDAKAREDLIAYLATLKAE